LEPQITRISQIKKADPQLGQMGQISGEGNLFSDNLLNLPNLRIILLESVKSVQSVVSSLL
jgi:hypothetical protein